jgi:DNA polymerase-3 subunit chi
LSTTVQVAAPPQRVDFYVLPGGDTRARLKFACRLAEKAYLARQRVLVWLEDAAALSSFDELLWTFSDRSFVPHERYAGTSPWQDTPVLLACPAPPTPPGQPAAAPQPLAAPDVLLNLASAVPEAAVQAGRVLEVIDSEPERLQAGRARFRHYRDRGLAPQTHRLSADGDGAP